MRNSIINAAELAAYDQLKQVAMQFGMPDGLPTHIFCAFGAGFTALIVGSPVDVLKTRIMNRKPGDGQSIPGLIGSMIAKEGPLAFYKGDSLLQGIHCKFHETWQLECCHETLEFYI